MSRRRPRALNTGTPRYRAKFRQVVERDGWVCWVCGWPIDPDAPPNDDGQASLDHVVELARGGSNSVENLRLAHRLCNEKRSTAWSRSVMRAA